MTSFQILVSEVFRPMTDFDIRPVTGPKQISAFDRNDGEDVQGQIGLRLRAVYEAIVAEPVPDRFRTLLESLDCSNERKT
jgi:hypothetical protein